MAIKFELAEREGARIVIGLAGVSGSGKTRTGLELGHGLVRGDTSKIGFVCTENRRGRLFARVLKDADGNVKKFFIHDLYAPFSPQRYIDVIEGAANAGFEVLIIDSISHEWEGTGGCEEIANPPGSNLKISKWNDAKAEHKRFMNALLSSPMHIIACMRAREKTKMERVNGKTEYVPQGIQPICEKNFPFELTVSIMMHDGGKQREVLKSHPDLEAIVGTVGWHKGFLGYEHGAAIREWIDGGSQVDAEAQRARDSLQMVTEKGLAELQKAWLALPAKIRKAINADGKCPESLKNSAA
ncbi:AAA family ATPase, partial [Caballeronia fortuita]|uniref:AAA family ATPase n=1 Tax=Caballeronia fortuita TaxID=1777138 RepID=UPI0007723A62